MSQKASSIRVYGMHTSWCKADEEDAMVRKDSSVRV